VHQLPQSPLTHMSCRALPRSRIDLCIEAPTAHVSQKKLRQLLSHCFTKDTIFLYLALSIQSPASGLQRQTPSKRAYDKQVAGVISGAGDYKPGIVLDKQQSSKTRKPIALLGKVYCKWMQDTAPSRLAICRRPPPRRDMS
jgi:hypothetical protein